MRSGYRTLWAGAAACWLVACGGRDAGDLLDVNGIYPGSGGSGGGGGKLTGGSPSKSGGAPPIASGGSPTGGSPVVGVGGGPSPFPPPTVQPPMPPVPPPVPPPVTSACSGVCDQLAVCGQGSRGCLGECESFLNRSAFGTGCYELRNAFVNCYRDVLAGTGCNSMHAEQKCRPLLDDAERCGQPVPPPPPPPPVGNCEDYCNFAFICSNTVQDGRYAECVNSCYSEVNSFTYPCRDYIVKSKQCRASVLRERCDFNDAQNRCYQLESDAYACQYGTPPMPVPPYPVPPYPVPPPPVGCVGSVNVPSSGYCEANLSCGKLTYGLQCQPNGFNGTTSCSCTQYYPEGGVAGYGFEVGYGDCQSAVTICSANGAIAF